MKHGIPTVRTPDDPHSIYMRVLYHEYFYGPFSDEQAVIAAINRLDEVDQYWDYDPFCLIYGANPLPTDYVFGFPNIPDDMNKRIRSARTRKD